MIINFKNLLKNSNDSSRVFLHFSFKIFKQLKILNFFKISFISSLNKIQN